MHPLFIEIKNRDWPEYLSDYRSEMPELMIHVASDLGYELELVDEIWNKGEFISAQVKVKKFKDYKKIFLDK